jgi:hypothetical protein
VRGEFERFGQTDWAVLATRNQKTCFVLIFWQGQCPPERILEEPILDCKGAFRRLRVATPRFIRHNLTYPPNLGRYPELSLPMHDGIEIGAYITEVYYFQSGSWHGLPCSHC